MEDIVQQFANVGFTLFCVVGCIILVHWLDKNVFNKNRRFRDDD